MRVCSAKFGVCVLAGMAIAAVLPASAMADVTSSRAGTTATMTGNSDSDLVLLDVSGGLVRHNRFTAGDAGYQNEFDFDTVTAGSQSITAGPGAHVSYTGGTGSDTLALSLASADPADGLFTVSQDGLGQEAGPFTASYDAVEAVLFGTTDQADTVHIEGTPPGPLVTISTNDGDDVIQPGSSCCEPSTLDRLGAPVNVAGGDDFDLLDVDDSSDTDSNRYLLRAGEVERVGSPVVSFTGIEDPRLNAGSGNDTIEASADLGASGGMGADRFVVSGDLSAGGEFTGSQGDDAFVLPAGAQARSLTGNAGTDTIDYSARSTAVDANLTTGVATGVGPVGLSGLESATGGSAADVLRGGALPGVLDGGAGGDSVFAGAAGGVLVGSAGGDTLRGGPAADELRAIDGEVDDAGCGGGADAVFADNADLVGGDCESVSFPPAPDPSGGDVGGGESGGEGGGGTAADTDPPETELTKQPKGATESRRARFGFRADEEGASFECKLDDGRYRECESPRRLRGLDLGKHLFRVRAVDTAGNVDPTPAKARWDVER